MTDTDISSYNSLFLRTANDHLQNVMDQLSGLTDSNRKKSLDEIYRQVHSLKGSSTVMGYTAIADLCKKIDDHINNPQIHLSKSETTKSIKELTIELKSQLSALENKDVKDLI